MAEGQYAVGEAVRSACCYLAVNEYARAIEKLRHSCEYELAYAVAHCFQHQGPQALQQTLDALAHRAELRGDTCMCIEILKRRYRDPSAYDKRCMALVVARSSLTDAEVDELYAELGVHERVMEIEEGKGADSEDDDDHMIEEQLMSLVLRRCHGSAARNGVFMLRRWLSAHTHAHAHVHEDDAHTCSPLDVNALRRLVHILWSINAGKLMERPRAELLAYLSYTGAMLAIDARMFCLVTFLIRNCRSLVESHRIKDFAVEDAELLLMEAQYALPGQLDKAMAALEDAMDNQTLNATQVSVGKSVLEALQEKRSKLRQRYRENWNKVSGDEFLPVNILQRHDASSALNRPTSPDAIVTTTTMTTATTTTQAASTTSAIARGRQAGGQGGDARAPVRYILCGPTIFSSASSNAAQGDKDGELISVVSNRAIQGPHVLLGDRTSAMALSEAYMLTEVLPFSPLNTGDRVRIP